jgi:hypothetical protein
VLKVLQVHKDLRVQPVLQVLLVLLDLKVLKEKEG